MDFLAQFSWVGHQHFCPVPGSLSVIHNPHRLGSEHDNSPKKRQRFNAGRRKSHKRDGIGDGRIRTFPFSCDSVYYLVKTRVSESEVEAGRINQSQSTFPRFVTGLLLPLLLSTSTT